MMKNRYSAKWAAGVFVAFAAVSALFSSCSGFEERSGAGEAQGTVTVRLRTELKADVSVDGGEFASASVKAAPEQPEGVYCFVYGVLADYNGYRRGWIEGYPVYAEADENGVYEFELPRVDDAMIYFAAYGKDVEPFYYYDKDASGKSVNAVLFSSKYPFAEDAYAFRSDAIPMELGDVASVKEISADLHQKYFTTVCYMDFSEFSTDPWNLIRDFTVGLEYEDVTDSRIEYECTYNRLFNKDNLELVEKNGKMMYRFAVEYLVPVWPELVFKYNTYDNRIVESSHTSPCDVYHYNTEVVVTVDDYGFVNY